MRKFPLWATIFTVIGVCILCALGTWQIERLAWKETLLTRLDAEYKKDPRDFLIEPAKLDAASFESPLVLRGYIEGTFRHDAEILIGPRTHEGKPGYHVITPLESNGSFLLVNRGWIPLDGKAEHPVGKVTVTGILRDLKGQGFMTPENTPQKNQWYWFDSDTIAKTFNLTPLTRHSILYAETQEPDSSMPLMKATRWQPPNNHLQYALFWFGMALLLMVFYVLRFWKR